MNHILSKINTNNFLYFVHYPALTSAAIGATSGVFFSIGCFNLYYDLMSSIKIKPKNRVVSLVKTSLNHLFIMSTAAFYGGIVGYTYGFFWYITLPYSAAEFYKIC